MHCGCRLPAAWGHPCEGAEDLNTQQTDLCVIATSLLHGALLKSLRWRIAPSVGRCFVPVSIAGTFSLWKHSKRSLLAPPHNHAPSETEGYLRAREEEDAREAERLRQLQEEREAEAAQVGAAAGALLRCALMCACARTLLVLCEVPPSPLGSL